MTTEIPWQEQEIREQEEAHERARGHVTELRRLWEVGAPLREALPLLDQIEADLNTSRPRHGGYATDYRPLADDAPAGPVSTPTGVSGNPNEPASNPPAGPVVVSDEESEKDGETLDES